MTVTVCATADLHGWLPPISPCDLLLIAGDICPPTDQRHWLDTNFRTWLVDSPARHVVATWGNNDVVPECGAAARSFNAEATVRSYVAPRRMSSRASGTLPLPGHTGRRGRQRLQSSHVRPLA